MTALRILIDSLAIGSLYALGAVGFTLMFGVCGILNLAHGATMVVAAMTAWMVAGRLGLGGVASLPAGLAAGVITALATYRLVVRPIQQSRALPEAEKEIFILTATLLWGILLREAVAYLFSDSPVSTPALIPGIVRLGRIRLPIDKLLDSFICWGAIAALWLLVNRTKMGQTLLGAAANPRAMTLLGHDLARVYRLTWILYGLLTGLAGVLLAGILGAGSAQSGQLTASAFTIVVLGGLGNVYGSLIAAYAVGTLETTTAYLLSPQIRSIPALLLLVLILYFRPQGLLGRR